MADTYCVDCDNLAEGRASHPRYWTCLKFPRTNEGFGFVTHSVWDKAEPFMYCTGINGGICPVFEPKKETE